MAEITSDVFDIFHPTPVPLRELPAIVISLEIWRCEINKYRSSGSLKDFRSSGQSVSSKAMIPDLPSVIYPIIDTYVERFGFSMNNWLWKHHRAVFNFYYESKNSVLEYFEDFVCDYNGTIHYERTAQRMMDCDQFDPDQKFLIACTYCFEDDIIRIWPLGLEKTDSLYKRFYANPQFAYWIDFLENDNRIPEPHIEDERLTEGWLISDFMPHSRSSLEYFWNHVPSENRLHAAIDLSVDDLPSFVRFILPKVDDQQLNEFLHENGCDLLYALLKRSCYDEEAILSSWICIKNLMNEIGFTNLIAKMMRSEVMGGYANSELHSTVIFSSDPSNHGDSCWHMDEYYVDDYRDLDNFLQLCFEIWNTASENLKRSVIRDIVSNIEIFERNREEFLCFESSPTLRELNFSSAVLSHATYEQRNAFWHNCWKNLITEDTCGEGLHEIMRLCLRDEDEITQFKKNIMANDLNMLSFCSRLLTKSCLEKLNNFVRFLLPDEEAAINFKRIIGYYDYLAFLND
ncbi:uncharacterized protein LOC135846369 isoform X2 [Planococcus citri]|uniref:uncharacterized protein LOC135846369 isoform X2 n=1 Tax=Planococcus citri TaxID=170843 RepID=UPI0031F8E683